MDFGEQANPYGDSASYQNLAVSKVSDLYGKARVAFIRKVYTVLLIQILFTVLFTLLSIYSIAFFQFQVQNFWLFIVAIVMAIVIQIIFFCCANCRKHPNDMVLTVLFTLAQSYIVSFICSATGKQSGNQIVLIAAVLTLAMVAACTAYAFYTQEDFTQCSAIVIIIGVVMLVLFIIMLFTKSPIINLIYCGLGVILFGIYLVIDTQMILGGRTIELAIDQYCLGAMLLYIDIITIFLYILEILQTLRGND